MGDAFIGGCGLPGIPGKPGDRAAEALLKGDPRAHPVTVRVITEDDGIFRKSQISRAIAEAQDKLVDSLLGTKFRVTGRLRFSAGMGVDVGVDALAVLERSALVIWVTEDKPVPLAPHFGPESTARPRTRMRSRPSPNRSVRKLVQ